MSFSTFIVLLFTLGSALAYPGLFFQQKLDQRVLDAFSSDNRLDVHVKLTKAPLFALNSLDALKSHTGGLFSQISDYFGIYQEHHDGVTHYWVSNTIFVRSATPLLIKILSQQPEVESIVGNDHIYIESFTDLEKPMKLSSSSSVDPWGVTRVHAPDAWQSGFSGQGVVVATLGTGVQMTHESLVHTYRGNSQDGSRNHDYNYYDAMESQTHTQEHMQQEPADDNGQGTAMTSVAVGQKGIGVAPGAQWIAVKACQANGACSLEHLLAASQWLACPTRQDGTEPNCALAPDIVLNGWGTGATLSNSTREVLERIVTAWTAAGIIAFFPQGGSGPSCGTIGSPADFKEVISAGALMEDYRLADFSSRGPPKQKEDMKPDVVAPGYHIPCALPCTTEPNPYTAVLTHSANTFTSDIDTSASPMADTSTCRDANGHDVTYGQMSGTSMAAAHVAGVTSIILSALDAKYPNLDAMERSKEAMRILTSTCQRSKLVPRGPFCGPGSDPNVYPNYNFGAGLIDACAAVTMAGVMCDASDGYYEGGEAVIVA